MKASEILQLITSNHLVEKTITIEPNEFLKTGEAVDACVGLQILHCFKNNIIYYLHF